MSMARPLLWGSALATLAVWLGCLHPSWYQGLVPGFRDTPNFYFPMWSSWDHLQGIDRWLPRWCHLDGTGNNLIGEGTSLSFYPLRCVLMMPLGSIAQRTGMFLVLHGMLAWATMAWSVQKTGAGCGVAALAAMSYSLAGPIFFQIHNPPFLISAAWLPLLLGSLVTALAGTSGGSNSQTHIAASLAASMSILGGDPQTVVHGMLLGTIAALFLSIRFFQRRLDSRLTIQPSIVDLRRHPLVAWFVFLAIGIAMAAVQWVPTAFWVAQSDRVADYRSVIYQFSVAPWHWPSLLVPGLGGSYVGGHTRWLAGLSAEGRMWVPSLHIATPIWIGLLCLLWVPTKRWSASRWIVAFGAMGAWSAMGDYAPGWYLNQLLSICRGQPTRWLPDAWGGLQWLWVEVVPGYQHFRYTAKWLPVTLWSLSWLGGHGLWMAIEQQDRMLRRRLSRIATVMAIAAVVLWIFVRMPASQSLWDEWSKRVTPDAILGSFQSERSHHMLEWQLVIFAAICFSIAFAWSGRPLGTASGRRGLAASLLLLMTLQLAWSARQECTFLSFQELQQKVAGAPLSDPSAVATGKLHWLVERRSLNADFTSRPMSLKKQLPQIDHRLWLGVGTPVNHALRFTWVDLTTQQGWRRTNAEHQVHPSQGRGDTPSRSLPENPGDEMTVLPSCQIDRIEVVGLWGPFTTDMEWEIAPAAKGLAFLPLYQDGGWSGWVSVKGEEASNALKLAKANGIGMAMEIPEGAVRVKLRYQTPGLKLGVLISLLGTACLLLGVYLVCLKQRSQVAGGDGSLRLPTITAADL
jgi:hypothetical protein